MVDLFVFFFFLLFGQLLRKENWPNYTLIDRLMLGVVPYQPGKGVPDLVNEIRFFIFRNLWISFFISFIHLGRIWYEIRCLSSKKVMLFRHHNYAKGREIVFDIDALWLYRCCTDFSILSFFLICRKINEQQQ